MANLIITVISIALVAVAALMGAYYGGNAFMDGQIKAKTNQMKGSLEQVAAAINLYDAQTGIKYKDAITGSNIASGANKALLVPNYLSIIPLLPKVDPDYFTDIFFAAGGPSTPNQYYLITNASPSGNNLPNLEKVCAEVAHQARGANGTPIQSLDYWINATGKFDCVFVNQSSASTPATFDQCLSDNITCAINIVYRVY